MNIKGIKLIREFGLEGPKKEIITKDISEIDLDWLYDGAIKDATILIFDYNEPINQNPLLEKNVRKYKIKKEEYYQILNNLVEELLQKGVKKEDMIFLTHQTYTPEEISYSGRVAIDGVESLRQANSDFSATFIYKCPILNGRLFRSEEKIIQQGFHLPEELLERLIQDILFLHKEHRNPCIDFEVYKKEGQLFYHDAFLSHKMKII